MHTNEFHTENQGIHTYLTYRFQEKENIDTMSLGMLSNNKVAGITPIIYGQVDSDNFFKYDITSKVTASQFLEGHVNKKRLVGLFSSIITAIMSAEEYMIDVNTLIFDLDYIYVDASTCKAEMVCLPLIAQDNQKFDLGLFFKDIMFSIQFDSTESSEYITKIMNYLNSSKNLNIADFKLMLDKLMNNQSESQSYQKKINVAMENKKPSQVYGGYSPSKNSGNSFDNLQKRTATKAKTANEETALVPKNDTPLNDIVQDMDNGEQISLFYLLQHYNKDNAAKYKEQKNNKKNLKSEKGSKTSKSSKEKKAKKQKNTSAVSAGFAVPGQKESFAIPEQAGDFAIPGQSQSIIKSEKEQKNGSLVSKEMSAYKETADQQSKPTYIPPNLEREDADFGDTVVMGNDMEFSEEATVLINNTVDMEAVPYLIRCRTNEKTMINKPLIKIGRDHKTVDYCISDNKAIGRNHANILSRGGEYFVVDINSINHTFVDDRMIPSGAETKLSHGAKLRLADEDFEFRMF